MPEIENNVVETKQVNVPISFVGTATVRLPEEWPDDDARVIALGLVLLTGDNPDAPLEDVLTNVRELCSNVTDSNFDELIASNTVSFSGVWVTPNYDLRIHDLAKSLAFQYGGHWNEHPEYPLSDWTYEVQNGDTRLGYWPWVLSKLSDEHVHLVVQNPGDVAIVFTRERLADLTDLLDYCQDDSERQDFCFHLSENYDAGLSESELETLVTGDDDEIQAILEKAAAKPDVTHIWAIAHRIRRLLPE